MKKKKKKKKKKEKERELLTLSRKVRLKQMTKNRKFNKKKMYDQARCINLKEGPKKSIQFTGVVVKIHYSNLHIVN